MSPAQFPVNDPLYAIPAMAAVTKNIVFGVTASTTYDAPYALARRFSTVDHLTEGRVAWNIVTSYLDSAAKNFGLDTQIEHDERYRIAEEYMEVVYKVKPVTPSWTTSTLVTTELIPHSYGKVVGTPRQRSETPPQGHSQQQGRSGKSIIKENTSPSQARTSANPHHNEHRSSSKPALPKPAPPSAQSTPKPYSSAARQQK